MNKKYTKSIQKLTKKANFSVIFFLKMCYLTKFDFPTLYGHYVHAMSWCLFDGESDIDGEDAEDNLVESDEDDNDMMPEKPQKPVSLNDCFKSLETIRDFYQSHGGDESVFNSVKNLEKVSFKSSSHKPQAVQSNWILQEMNCI